MRQIQRIVAPTDFSDAGRSALVYAAKLAARFDAELHVLHVAQVLDPLSVCPMYDWPRPSVDVSKEMTGRAGAQLRETLDELPIQGTQVVAEVRLAQFPGPAIVDYAREVEADHLVLGTHGRRGFRRFLLGSVAEEVTRTAPCPVTTLRPDNDTRVHPRRVLAAVDLGPQTPDVLAKAQGFAQLAGEDHSVDLYVVHVLSPLAVPGFYEYGVSLVDLPSAEEMRESALHRLRQVTADLTVPVHCEVAQGTAYEEIVEAAEKREVDLLVLGSHSRTGVPYALLGSVAEKVVRGANCPTLVVHGEASEHDEASSSQVA